MKKRKVMIEELNKKIDEINYVLSKNRVLDLVELLGDRKKLFVRNLWSGMVKGIGIGIGVTVITGILVVILQKIVYFKIEL